MGGEAAFEALAIRVLTKIIVSMEMLVTGTIKVNDADDNGDNDDEDDDTDDDDDGDDDDDDCNDDKDDGN